MARQAMHNRRAGRGSTGGGASWISYSDMMAALLLIFVLILSYSLYQYFTMLETKTRELEDQRLILISQQEELDEKEKTLIIIRADLDAKQTELDEANAALKNREEELNSLQIILGEKEQELDGIQIILTEKEAATRHTMVERNGLHGKTTVVVDYFSERGVNGNEIHFVAKTAAKQFALKGEQVVVLHRGIDAQPRRAPKHTES